MPSRATMGQLLCFGTLFLCLGVVAQAQNDGLNDLPDCAKSCVADAATKSGCSTTDTSCVCSKPTFATDMFSCADQGCNFGDRSSAHGIFDQICANAGTTTAAGSTSTSQSPAGTSSSIINTPSGSSQPAKANPAAASATSAAASASGAAASSGSTPTVTPAVVGGNTTPATNPSGSISSTVTAVQTVVVDPSLSAAGKADIPFSQVGAVFLTLAVGWIAATGMLVGV